ncbi:hypothetical protein [Ramlibacter sp.]|uniref:hypothetical protein n=1 Tax=Ramlibacter sp. TaxID=1917967 RepID=UPI003D0B37F9
MKIPRHRTWFVFVAALAILLVRMLTDTGGLAKSAAWLIEVCTGIALVTICHVARKAYLDYGAHTDMRKLFATAAGTPNGAGLALVAIAIFFLGFALIFSPRAAAGELELQLAAQHLPAVKRELQAHWPGAPRREYVPALISHESACPRRTQCWNAKARLKSAREEGAGLGQITRTWRKDGTQRFDKLQELVDQHPQLQGWTWSNVFERADLQVRAVVLLARGEFERFAPGAADTMEALAFADAAYNGGAGGVRQEMRACKLAPDCDPRRWFAHVERYCMKSQAAMYGQRSACDINRHHVRDVWARMPRYRGLM